jgi:hypothetical protein
VSAQHHPGAVRAQTLGVAPAGSHHEREAERAATTVAGGGFVADWSFSAVAGEPGSVVQRSAGDDRATSDVRLGTGRPLDSRTRSFMERGFGADFSAVRIHVDGAADASATAIGAEAFTLGEDVTFAAGRYAPTTGPGRHLIAHELAHVVQQRCSPGAAAPIQRYTRFSDAEQEDGSSRGWKHPTTQPIRVADDGQMATEGADWGPGANKRAWTTPRLLSGANALLRAHGSIAELRPKPGGQSVSGMAPVGGAQASLTEIEPHNSRGGTFRLASDCGTAARQITGSGKGGDGSSLGTGLGIGGVVLGGVAGLATGLAIGGVWGAVIGGIVGVAAAIGGWFGGRAIGRAAGRKDPGADPSVRDVAVMRDAGHPGTERYSAPETYHGGGAGGTGLTPAEVYSGALYQRELGGATRDEALQRYAALPPAERDAFDRRHGINRYARPHVGEAITIGTEYHMPGYADPTASAWNFHYAATVLESGDDYVTLESAAGWEDDDWSWFMYGPPSKDQTFQEEQAASGTHGSRQTSLVVMPEQRLDVRTVAATTLTGDGETFALPAGQQLRVLERRAGGSVHVRVVGGPDQGAEGWLSEGALR